MVVRRTPRGESRVAAAETKMDSTDLQAVYEEMSRDLQHETEALDWCEALVGDAFLGDSDEHPG